MKKLILTLCASLFALSNIYALNARDILVVDVGAVYNSYYRAQEAQEKLQEVVDNAQEELDKMMQEGMALAKELEDLQAKFNNPALTEEARSRYMDQARPKAEQLQQAEIKINEFRQDKQVQFNERRQAMLNLYLREIADAATKLAEKRGSKIVLNSNALIYSDDAMDITEDLIREINSDQSSSRSSSRSSGKKK